MKKTIIFVTIALLNANSFAFQDLQSTLPSLALEDHKDFLGSSLVPHHTLIDQVIDEDDSMLPNIQEYDQHVSDTVTVLKPSAIEIALQKMMGVVLIHYMNLRECAREYYSNVSNFVAKWYHNIIK